LGKVGVVFSPNFERNLEAVRAFLQECDAASAYASLLDSVVDRLVPMLESHPRMGRDWMLRVPLSGKGRAARTRIQAKLGKSRELREFVLDDYLVLYSIDGAVVSLLAIRHQRQLMFDVERGG
jgi:hypothetical protein